LLLFFQGASYRYAVLFISDKVIKLFNGSAFNMIDGFLSQHIGRGFDGRFFLAVALFFAVCVFILFRSFRFLLLRFSFFLFCGIILLLCLRFFGFFRGFNSFFVRSFLFFISGFFGLGFSSFIFIVGSFCFSFFFCLFSFSFFLFFLFLSGGKGFLLRFFAGCFFRFLFKLLLEFLFFGFEQRFLTFFARGNIFFFLFPLFAPFRQSFLDLFVRLAPSNQVHLVHQPLIFENRSDGIRRLSTLL